MHNRAAHEIMSFSLKPSKCTIFVQKCVCEILNNPWRHPSPISSPLACSQLKFQALEVHAAGSQLRTLPHSCFPPLPSLYGPSRLHPLIYGHWCDCSALLYGSLCHAGLVINDYHKVR